LPQRHKARCLKQFPLQCLEEGLHLGIVSALSRPIHAMTKLVLFQERLRFVGPVFDATIRMEQQTGRGLACLECVSQCCPGEVRIQVFAQPPTDNATGEQIQNNGQEYVLSPQLE